MERRALLFRNLYTPTEHVRDGVLTMVGERIESVRPLSEAARCRPEEELEGFEIYDAADGIVLPGLIDIHLHGACGHNFLSADVAAHLPTVASGLCRFGVTGFLLTLGHAPWALLAGALGRAGRLASASGHGAMCLGVNMEGPFINPTRVGAGSPRCCLPPSEELLREMLDLASGSLRVMTVAPELEGGLEAIASLARSGVVPAIGHTEAAFEESVAAVDAGARLATHVFNAMAPFHHRSPGPVGAVLACNELSAELIADGQHVHAGAMRALVRAKGADGVIIVSDGTPLLGSEEGTYLDAEGREIRVESGACRAPDGNLAGSATPLNRALAILRAATGLPTGEAARMATLNPARLLGIAERKGSLEPGKDADIAVVDEGFEVHMTFARGQLSFHG